MKKNFIKIIFAFVFLIIFIPNVNAGLYVGDCVPIPGTEGQGPNGGIRHDCPNMNYDGVPVHCVEWSVLAIEGDVCTESQVGAGTTCKTCCENPTLSAIPQTQNLKLSHLSEDEKYYISDPITVNVSVCSGNNAYVPTLKEVSNGFLPEGTEIIDEDGKIITNKESTSRTIRVRIPSANVTKKVNFNIAFSLDYSFTRVHTYSYARYWTCPGQDVQSNETYSGENSETIAGKLNAEVNLTINTGDLQVEKYDHTDGNLLEGIEFKLYLDAACTKEAKTADRKAIRIITKANGYAEVKNILYGTYYLKETKTGSTYEVLVSPEQVAITGDTTRVTIANTPIDIYISKQDITKTKELEGALIRITDASGNVVFKEFYSTSEPTKIRFEKGVYILTEVIAPAGYSPVENSVTFKVDEMGKITIISINDEEFDYTDDTITIYNDVSKVIVSKQDITSTKELKGAKITVTCDNGFSETWESTDKPRKLDIAPGAVCTLTEEVAPEGYDKIKTSLKFKVKDNGDVEVVGNADGAYYLDSNRIVIYNGAIVVPVPDTGAFVWIGTILIGGGLVFIGYRFINANKKENTNSENNEVIAKETKTKEKPKKVKKERPKKDEKNLK